MPRRLNSLLLIAMFGLCFATLGRTPRMPEMRGAATLEMAQREGAVRADDVA